jgi:tetratricopeptide (TPR) repeat protein
MPELPAVSDPRTLTLPRAGDRLGDYLLLGELGRGGMALILDAVHEPTGERRALKLMLGAGLSEEALQRFELEFRALSHLDHSGVLKVHDTGFWGERPYFTMERLEGVQLGAAVEEWQELPPGERYARAEDVLVQLAEALEHIHEHGLVHRDLTPSNIMVLPDGRIKLMDFGVVKAPGAELTEVGAVVGTVAYISPEQVDGREVDARADLYALGGVLYLMLTGRRPFNARTLSGYLDKHRNRPVRPPREVAPSVPARLDQICVRLMEKEPGDRFASASHLLHVLHAGGDLVPARVGPSWVPGLVGRSRALSDLRQSLARVDGDVPGPAQVLLISGEPGSGRSRLLAEAARQAVEIGMPLTMSSLPPQNAAPRAMSGWRRLYQDLLDAGLCDLHPVLEAAFGGAPGSMSRWQVAEALTSLLNSAGPRLVALDDVDAWDVGTQQLTSHLVGALLGGQGPGVLLVLASAALPDGAVPAFLPAGVRDDDNFVEVRLGPIEPSAVEELVLTVLDDEPAVRRLADRLHHASEGRPAWLVEMMVELRQSGAITESRTGRDRLVWSGDEVDTSPLPIPIAVEAALRRQLGLLVPEAVLPAHLLALASEAVDLDVLQAASRLPMDELLDAIDSLLGAGLAGVTEVGGQERFALLPVRAADLLTRDMATERRMALHRALGAALERTHRKHVETMVERLAGHFERGGLPAKAGAYLAQAAQQASADGHVEHALRLVERALELEPMSREVLTLRDADQRLAELVLQRAGDLFHLGRWSDAGTEAVRADQLALELGDDRLLAATATELGRQARRVPDLAEAERQLKRALTHIQAAGDRRLAAVPLYECGAVLWARGQVDEAREYWLEARALAETFQDERGLAMVCNGLALLAIAEGNTAEARRQLEQAVQVAIDHGLVERLAVSRTNLVELFHSTGNLRRAIELADQTVNEAREAGHQLGVGLGLRYRALLLTDLGRFADALDNANEALRIHTALGNPEEELAVHVVLMRLAFEAGDDEDAEALLPRAMELLPDFDTEGYAGVVHGWRAQLHAAGGRTGAARQALDAAEAVSERQWPLQQARVLVTRARAHELLGERALANSLAERALRVADAAGYRYLALRARQQAARTGDDPAAVSRHRRVADALARSLASSLPRDDARSFLERMERALVPDAPPP